MCAYVQSLPAPTLEPRRCMLAACPFLRRAPVLRLKRNLRLSKLFFLWTAHQSLRKHYTAVFEVNIQFFFSSKLWMRSSGHGSAAVAPHFFKLYVCAPMQMRQLCFCGRKDWFKLTENDWFSELAFILSSPFFSHSFTTVFVFPLCWAEAFRNKVKKKQSDLQGTSQRLKHFLLIILLGLWLTKLTHSWLAGLWITSDKHKKLN